MADMMDPGEDTSGFSKAIAGSSHAATANAQTVSRRGGGGGYKEVEQEEQMVRGTCVQDARPLGDGGESFLGPDVGLGVFGPALRPDLGDQSSRVSRTRGEKTTSWRRRGRGLAQRMKRIGGCVFQTLPMGRIRDRKVSRRR